MCHTLISRLKGLARGGLACAVLLWSSAPALSQPTAKGEVSYGTGFILSAEGHIATCWHVVSNASRILIRTRDGQEILATNAARLEVDDVAVLKPTARVKLEGALPVLEQASGVQHGDEVWTAGFPNPELQGYSAKISNGIVNSLTGPFDKKRFLQISIPLQPGNSGSPLVDLKGNVVGMVQLTMGSLQVVQATGSVPQNVNYAIKSESLFYAARMAGTKLISPNWFNRTKASRIEALLNCTVLIEARQ